MKRTWTHLLLDGALFVAVILLTEPRTSGLAVHEWLGLILALPVLAHLLLAWRWLAALPSRLRAKGAWRLRANVLLNSALFVSFIVTLYSGAMTSFVALPALGFPAKDFEGWRLLHRQWEAYLEITVALHIAMNWNWILGALRRLTAKPYAGGAATLPAGMLKP